MKKWWPHIACAGMACACLAHASAADPPAGMSIVQRYEQSVTNGALGLDTTFFMGFSTKNGFGFLKQTIGVSTGLDIRKVTNLPSVWVVQDVERRIKAENPTLVGEALVRRIAEEVNPGHFNYIQFGTEKLYYPKVGIGTLVPFSRAISNVAYFDFGVSYPTTLNLGIFLAF